MILTRACPSSDPRVAGEQVRVSLCAAALHSCVCCPRFSEGWLCGPDVIQWAIMLCLLLAHCSRATAAWPWSLRSSARGLLCESAGPEPSLAADRKLGWKQSWECNRFGLGECPGWHLSSCAACLPQQCCRLSDSVGTLTNSCLMSFSSGLGRGPCA